MTRHSDKRKPVPHHTKPAIKNKRSQFTRITREIGGTLLAAAIFAASVLTSAFGMAGGFDREEPTLVAGVDQHGR